MSKINQREVGFLLIGLGFGLTFTLAAAMELLFASHGVLISGMRIGSTKFGPDLVFLTLPLLLIFTGVILLSRRPAQKPD